MMMDAVAVNIEAASTVGLRVAAEKRKAAGPTTTGAYHIEKKTRQAQAVMGPTAAEEPMAPIPGTTAPQAARPHLTNGRMMTVALASKPTRRTRRRYGRLPGKTDRKIHRRQRMKLTQFERR